MAEKSEIGDAETDTNTFLTKYKHVPPRLSDDWYQVEIPEFVGYVKPNLEDTDYSAPVSYAELESKQNNECIIAIRNIFSMHLCPMGSSTWRESLVDIPLEADERLLDYLHKFNYDSQKALFSLMVELGRGKEHVFSHRTFEQVKRNSVGIVFMECKEKFVLSSPQSAVGQIVVHPRLSSNSTSILPPLSLDDDMRDAGDAVSPKVSPHSLARSRYLGNHTNIANTRGASFDNGNGTVGNTKPIESQPGSTSASTNNCTSEEPLADSATFTGRVSRTAGVTDKENKNNIKKEWLNIYKQASEFLLKTGNGHAGSLVSRSVSNATSGSSTRQQLEEADVMALLTNAAVLPAYINSPGECFAETVRSALGELLILCSSSQAWSSEVRDALYSAIYPSLPLSKFKSLESEGVALKLVNKVFLTNYRWILKEYEDVNKATELLLSRSSECESAQKLTLQEARTLLQRDKNLPRAPALHNRTAELEHIVSTSEQLMSEMNDVLIRAEICSLRKHRIPLREKAGLIAATEAMESSSGAAAAATANTSLSTVALQMSLPIVQVLRSQVLASPIVIPGTNNFMAVLDKGEQWQKQVHQLMEADAEPLQQQTSRKSSSQSLGQGRAVSLKRVESLVSEGEKLAFVFTVEMDYLRDKRLLAKEWLDKLKKSFSARAFNSNNRASLRKTTSSGEVSGPESGPPEKLRLEDMKLMVEEGQFICDVDGVQADENATAAEGGGTAPSRTAQARELNKAQTAVTAAEEWLSRVRELLALDEASFLERSASDKLSKRRESDNQEEDMDEDDEDSEPEDLRSILRDMLSDADDMPVQMDEATVLRVHLRALDWADKARKVLPTCAPVSSAGSNAVNQDSAEDSEEQQEVDRNSDDEEKTAKGKLKNTSSSKSKGSPRKPTFQELQKLVNEIKSIRKELPESMAEEFGVRKLYEEEHCCNLVDQVERLLAAIKRITQGTNVKKGTKLTRMVDLLAEVSLLPLTLTAECRPLRSTLSNITDWMQKNSSSLAAIGISCDLSQTDVQVAAERLKQQIEQTNESNDNDEDGEGDESALAAAVEGDSLVGQENESVAMSTVLAEPTVTLPELKKVLDEAEGISVDFFELKSARQRLVKAQSWLAQASEKLANVSFGDITNASNSTNAAVSVGGSKSKVHHSSSRCSEAHLQAMLKEVSSLQIAFPEEVQGLQRLAEEIREYDYKLEISLLTAADHLLPLAHEYFQLVETSGLDGLGSDCFRDITISHNVQKSVPKGPAKLTEDAGELSLWSKFEEYQRMLTGISKHNEDTGILSKHSADVSVGLAAMQWVAHVRRLVIDLSDNASLDEKLLWGDIPKATLKGLQRDCEWYLNLHEKTFTSANAPAPPQCEHPALAAFDPKLLTDDSDEAFDQREKLLLILFPYDSNIGPELYETAKDRNKTADSETDLIACKNGGEGENLSNEYCASAYIESDDEADNVAEASALADKANARQSRGSRKVSAAADSSESLPSPRHSAPRGATSSASNVVKATKSRSASKKSASKLQNEPGDADVMVDGSHDDHDEDHNGFGDENEDDVVAISHIKQSSRKKRKAGVGSDELPASHSKKVKRENFDNEDASTAAARKRPRNDETEGLSVSITAKSKDKKAVKEIVVATAASKVRKGTDKQQQQQLVEAKEAEGSEDDAEEDDDEEKEQYKVVVTNHISAQRRAYTAVINSSSATAAQDEALMQLRHAFAQLVNFWYRVLLLLKARINESLKWGLKIHHWQQSAADLGNAIFSISTSSGNKDKQSDGVLSKLAKIKVLYSKAESLLSHANMRGIQSTVRRDFEKSFQDASEWYKQAQKMLRRESSALLKPSELSLFIRRGEALVVVGEGQYDSSLGSSAAKTDAPKDKDGAAVEGVTLAPDWIKTSTGFYSTIVKLKADLRASKALINKIQAHTKAETQSTAISSEMDALLVEADGLAVDMTEATESIRQVVKCYCFCRLGFHGEMIGCDKCNDWYHLSCINISQQTAEKTESYVCIRCQIQLSFVDTCRKVAQITNKWMKPIELAKQREVKKAKLEKRLVRESADVISLESQRDLHLQKKRILLEGKENPALTNAGVSMEVASAGLSLSASASSTASDPLAALPSDIQLLETMIVQIQRSLSEARSKLTKSLAEEEYINVQIELETTFRQSTTDWMQAMQGVMWPGNPEDLEIGRPHVPFQPPSGSQPTAASSKSESSCTEEDAIGTRLALCYSLKNLHLIPSSSSKGSPSTSSSSKSPAAYSAFSQPTRLLPLGMEKAYEAAKALSISEIEDVQLVFEAFRYMSWLNILLNCLRRPLPVVVLKMLLTAVQSFSSTPSSPSTTLPWIDEKLIKSLNGILTRAIQWKQRVKKLILPPNYSSQSPQQNQWVEAARLKALVDEAVTLPFVSRLKTEVANLVSDWYSKQAERNEKSGKSKDKEVFEDIPPIVPPPVRRGPPSKIPVIPIHPTTHINLNIPSLFRNVEAYCQVTGAHDTAAAAVVDYFSDDEDLVNLKGDIQQTSHIDRIEYTWTYASNLKPSPCPRDFWPPVLDIDRIKLIRPQQTLDK